MKSVVLLLVMAVIALAAFLGYSYGDYRNAAKINKLNSQLVELQKKEAELTGQLKAAQQSALENERLANAVSGQINNVTASLGAVKDKTNAISAILKATENKKQESLAKIETTSGDCAALCADRARAGYPCQVNHCKFFFNIGQ